MRQFNRITFVYFPPEASIPIVAWFLDKLDHWLERSKAGLVISDMKFGRTGFDISWGLTGQVDEGLESELEEQFEWLCRKINRGV